MRWKARVACPTCRLRVLLSGGTFSTCGDVGDYFVDDGQTMYVTQNRDRILKGSHPPIKPAKAAIWEIMRITMAIIKGRWWFDWIHSVSPPFQLQHETWSRSVPNVSLFQRISASVSIVWWTLPCATWSTRALKKISSGVVSVEWNHSPFYC